MQKYQRLTVSHFCLHFRANLKARLLIAIFTGSTPIRWPFETTTGRRIEAPKANGNYTIYPRTSKNCEIWLTIGQTFLVDSKVWQKCRTNRFAQEQSIAKI